MRDVFKGGRETVIDIHCHLLPYVDDGANDLEEAKRLLASEADQGVTDLYFTPHLRAGMFETPDEKILLQFERLAPVANEMGIRVGVSREYHFDEILSEKLEAGTVMPVGRNVILTEFSSQHSAEQIMSAVKRIRAYGFTAMAAHVERYPAADVGLIRALRSEGTLIQINADSVLGYDGRFAKKFVWELLCENLADVVASDAHDTFDRPVRMRECMALISKKTGNELAEKVMLHNPYKIIKG